tara:strand:- start:3914 stop:5662 length:1749 start_codon:yes stop_codon:yes gene_type:complete
LNNFYTNKSLLGNQWEIKDCDERKSLMISQRHNISLIISKIIFLRNIKEDEVENFLNPNFNSNLPNPFILKDMEKSINKLVENITNKSKIGIISDYDVDGSTSAAILFNFLKSINCEVTVKIPNRINEGYGPNKRIIAEFNKEKINILITLDCGTTAFKIFEEGDFDTIILDHHISEKKFPKVFSIINPNRYDEKNNLNHLATAGIAFLFIMALRKKLRQNNYFNDKIKEPNLINYLDLVALGTVCDVVNLNNYNRNFVIKGLEILKKRLHKGIKKIIDNSKINNSPSTRDLGFLIGPQLNAASRIDDPFLSVKILTSNDDIEIENIANKLMLLNEKRKLIENSILEEALKQINAQKNNKFIIIKGQNWHQGVLGIIASKLVDKFNKPTFIISFNTNTGVGSARSIENIDIGNIILNAKRNKILISGGGHKMAAGFKIDINKINDFANYLITSLKIYEESYFQKIDYYDLKISVDEVNINLLNEISKLEPFGNGNEEPKFIIKGLKVDSYRIIKEKHLLIFFKNNHGDSLKGICFNCIDTNLAENIINNKSANFEFGCTITSDNFGNNLKPQLIIKDGLIIN